MRGKLSNLPTTGALAGCRSRWSCSRSIGVRPCRSIPRRTTGPIRRSRIPDARPSPEDQPAVYVLPAADKERAALLGKRLGAEARIEEVAGSDGKPRLVVVRLDTETSAQSGPPVASFLDQIDLVSARIEPNEARSGGEVRVYLTWSSRRQIGDDYTMFLHLRRGAAETVAQVDVRPGSDRAPTYDWRPGRRVFDELTLMTPDGAAPGELRVVLGLYRAAGAQRLPATVDGQAVAGGEVEIGRVIVAR